MKRIIGVLTLLLMAVSANAQHRDMVEIYFDQGSSTIDRDFSANEIMLDWLSAKLGTIAADSTMVVTKITIESSTSPEGGLEMNKDLSQSRADVVLEFINGLGLEIPESLIEVSSYGIAWGDLRKFVSASDMADKAEVLRIIDEVPVETWGESDSSRWLKLVDSRNKQLMDLSYGNAYRYMLENYFPLLRKSSVVTIYTMEVAPPESDDSDSRESVAAFEPEEEEEPAEEPAAVESDSEPEIKPLLAIKTNLLYDAITALNLEIEVPIGDRWSIAGEWTFPWWTSGDSEAGTRNCFQLLNGNLEAKYWFGDRTERAVMTGWHLGLYAGGGLYDLGRDTKGSQGEFFSAGLSGGYAHTINKSGNLRLEYSLAVGYLRTEYNRYTPYWSESDSWYGLRQESGNVSWFGPTRGRVSLVWMLNRKVNKEN